MFPRMLDRNEKRTSETDIWGRSVDSVRAQVPPVCEVATRRFSMKRDMVTALRLPVVMSADCRDLRYEKMYLHAQRVQSLRMPCRQYICHLDSSQLQKTHGYQCCNAANVHGQCDTDIDMSERTKGYGLQNTYKKYVVPESKGQPARTASTAILK